MARADTPVPSRRRFLPNYVDSRGGTWWIHRIAPFTVSGDVAAFFRRLEEIVAAIPRTEIVVATDEYLHAVCRSRRGHCDDLEFLFSRTEGVVHVLSAPRDGMYDFGVNRRRVQRVRKRLRDRDT